ncbi:MAG: potassium/proton antiporter [Chitinophagaceae bacterium]
MSLSTENILLLGSLLLIVSIVASKPFNRLGIPILILFLLVGMLAGSDGVGGIYFDDPALTQFLGVVALNFILFSGGIDTKWSTAKPIVGRAIVLSTAGVLITAVTLGVFVHLITDFTLLEGILLGAIVSSTDAAAVFSILRSRNIELKNNLGPTLEMESGSNDAMVYVIMISIIYMVQNGSGDYGTVILNFLQEMSFGAIMGFACGKGMVLLLNRIRLEIEGLYPVLLMALIFFTFSFTSLIHGNGFLAVYIAALILGNSNFAHKKILMRFYDGQAWLMQVLMFLTLGLLVFPSRLVPIAGLGIFISFFLIIIARPLGVFICLYFFKVSNKEKLFISWVGLRGAVPIVFATYPLLAGLDKAGMIFDLVFFIAVSSVLIQGTTLPALAQWLNLIEKAQGTRDKAQAAS